MRYSSRALVHPCSGQQVPGRQQVSEELLKEDGGVGGQAAHERTDLWLQDLSKADVKVGVLPASAAQSLRLTCGSAAVTQLCTACALLRLVPGAQVVHPVLVSGVSY